MISTRDRREAIALIEEAALPPGRAGRAPARCWA